MALTIRFSEIRGVKAGPLVATIAPGEQVYTTAGTFSWVAPPGVTSVSAVCVGGGAHGFEPFAGAGGGLGWKNNITVVPGQSYSVFVGAVSETSYFINSSIVAGGGAITNTPGTHTGDGGADGGATNSSGGGGAAGYNGANSGGGGHGGNNGNGWGGGGGGGVGLYGQGTTGADRVQVTGGGGGSGGTNGTDGAPGGLAGRGGLYGGGGGLALAVNQYGYAKPGAVRVIWGTGRSFPSNAA